MRLALWILASCQGGRETIATRFAKGWCDANRPRLAADADLSTTAALHATLSNKGSSLAELRSSARGRGG
jgi:hypothetical protein